LVAQQLLEAVMIEEQFGRRNGSQMKDAPNMEGDQELVNWLKELKFGKDVINTVSWMQMET